MEEHDDWPKPRLGLFAVLYLGIPIAVVVGAFLLLGHLSVVTSEYDTYEDAVADNLFNRGWLPHFIPASATDIVTRNDLDFNTSHGGFQYDLADTDTFLANLKPLHSYSAPYVSYAAYVAEMKADGYAAWQLENADGARDDINRGTFWVFFIDARRGRVVYDSWPHPDLR